MNDNGKLNISTDRVRRYYPVPYVPPVIEEVYDVGKDMNLRKSVTDFYYEKLLKWIKTDSDFSGHKKDLGFLHTKAGYKYIYYLLRVYVKNGSANWYDLRDPINYPNIKKYLNFKVGSF
jgi:hypothetical protein